MAKSKPPKASVSRPKARKAAPKKPPKARPAVKKSAGKPNARKAVPKTQLKSRPAVKKSAGKKPSRPKSLKEMSNDERLIVLGESKQNLRESSFHEAGHAVWTFLDGRLDSIKQIEIGYRDGAMGRIQWSYHIYSHKIGLQGVLSSPQCLAASCIASCFSGWACEYIHTKEDDPWERVLDEWYDGIRDVMAIPPAERPLQCDFEEAANLALIRLNMRGRPLDSLGEEPMALLEQVWDWTIELFRLPQVWKVVNALARELIAQAPGTMSGRKAQRIIRAAWKGPPKQVPMAHLCDPWVDRFDIEHGVDRPF